MREGPRTLAGAPFVRSHSHEDMVLASLGRSVEVVTCLYVHVLGKARAGQYQRASLLEMVPASVPVSAASVSLSGACWAPNMPMPILFAPPPLWMLGRREKYGYVYVWAP